MLIKKDPKQLELFKEFTKASEIRSRRFNLPSISGEKIILQFSYEKVVFVIIGFVLLSALIFSLGVESGRQLKFAKSEKKRESIIETVQTNNSADEEKEIKNKIAEEVKIVDMQPLKQNLDNKQASDIKSEFHTIQVAAYKSVSQAVKEKQKIQKSGVESFIIASKNGFFSVCAGQFNDITSAKKKLTDLKKNYHDCFIKKVNRNDVYKDEKIL